MTSLQSKVIFAPTANFASADGVTSVGAGSAELPVVDEDAAVTDSGVDRVLPAKLAEMLTVLDAETVFVLTVKLAEDAPAGTVTLEGTETTLVFPLESETTEPPEGAAAVNATVPTVEFPPTTLFDPTVSEKSTGAVFAPPLTTQMPVWRKSLDVVATSFVHDVLFGNPVNVETGKLALVAPAGTVTVEGTLALPGT